MLQSATKTEIDAIWIGRDLGYRGGRRTGLALTDDVHIHAHAERWGVSVERPTKGKAVAERTAAVIWRILSQIECSIFLWNVFPLHPHVSHEPFSNRSHNSRERRAGEEVLFQLMPLLKPRRLIAIGNDAALTACRLADRHEVAQVRHPSYGGQAKFFLLIHEAQQGCRDATYEPSRFPVAVPYPSPHRATPAYVVVTSSDLDTSRNKASVSGLSWISRKFFGTNP